MLKALEERIIQISDRDYEAKPFSLEHLLVMASRLYGWGVGLWQRAYALGVFPAASMPCPVISIGNIMAGGTGKTPMTFYLVRRLKAMGLRPVVISRGYGGTLKEAAAVVGDGESIFLDAEAAGDEPLMMAQRLGVPVVVGRDRRRAGQLAVETFNPDLLVMDDGFQHLKLKRDLDLVLLDHDRPFGNGRFLPAGRLRETAAMAARRAHGLILTRCPEGGGAVPPSIDTTFPGCPAFKTRHRSVLAAWIGGSDGGGSLAELRGRRAFLVSGIARNDAFRQSVAALGANVVGHLEFQDHYGYKRADFSTIQTEADQTRAELVITTEKDWVKFPAQWEGPMALVVLGVELECEDAVQFDTFIRDRIHP